ncbi:MAG: hypothetical protein MZV63_15940 [Marinilabiliales bacterium]|nr:hypothetical protein [Marinilabiliales bacterium]
MTIQREGRAARRDRAIPARARPRISRPATRCRRPRSADAVPVDHWYFLVRHRCAARRARAGAVVVAGRLDHGRPGIDDERKRSLAGRAGAAACRRHPAAGSVWRC